MSADIKIQVTLDSSGTLKAAKVIRSSLGGIASDADDMGQRVSRATAQMDGALSRSAASARSQALAMGVGVAAGQVLGNVLGQLISAFPRLVAQQAAYANSVAQFSERIGASTEEVSALSASAKASGAQFSDVTATLQTLSNNAASAAAGVGRGARQSVAAFAALGVSVRDARGQIKPTTAILAEVAQKLAALPDGALKTRLQTELLGQSSTQLDETLNDLAQRGLQGVIDKAGETGQLIGPVAAAQAKLFENQLGELKGKLDGLSQGITQATLPAVNGLIGAFLGSNGAAAGAAAQFDGFRTTMNDVGLAVLSAVETIKVLSTMIFATIDTVGAVGEAINGVVENLYHMNAAAGRALVGDMAGAKDEVAAAGKALGDAWESARARVTGAMTAVTEAGADADAALAKYSKATAQASSQFADVVAGNSVADAAAAAKSAAATKAQAAALKAYQDALARAAAQARSSASDVDMLANAQKRFDDMVDTARGKLDPATKAQTEYNKELREHEALAERLITAGGDVIKTIEDWQEADAASAQQFAQTNAELAKRADVLGQFTHDEALKQAQIGMTDRERYIAQAVEDVTKKWEENSTAGIKNAQTLQQVKDGAAAAATKTFDLGHASEETKNRMRDFQQAIEQVGESIADAFADALVHGGSLLKSLADIAKNVVQQIIAYFARLAVINPILNSIFGAVGGSLLPTLAGAATSGVASGAASTAAGAAAGQFNILQPATWLAAGKSLWGGFSGAMQSFWSGSAYNPASVNFMGPPVAGQTFGPQYGGYGSGFGQALGVGASIYSGYNRFQSAGGGVAGLAGGAAYGAGTYVLGAGLSSAAAGTGFASGLGALGPVGWIALAAMLIDKFSGGKLFGTVGKVIGGGSTFDVTSAGVDLSQHYTTKGQKPLFGGATFDEHNVAPSQEAIDAADQFFESLKTGTANFAKRFGVEMGDIVGGTFEQTFDKNGKVTGSTTTIAGHTYSGESQDQFTERLQAENMLAVLGQFDSGLNAAVDQFRANADQLMAVTGQLANAESMMQAGTKFLALGSDQSLTALLNLAEGAQQFGESIDQTLQRIEQAQAAYDQFVAQFKPAGTYIDDFEGAMAQLRNQLQANIDQANALAKAAGAAGASTEDLANITQAAAVAQAQLIAQLQASAQDLAFSLGLTTTGSLDAVNQEIARLQAEAGGGSNALHGFGDAVNSVAQAAQSAAQLMLGDLSPLNDTQKLQYALDAFHRGAASTEDVLSVAARLWTTSSTQYKDLFNQLQGATPTSATAAVAANQGGLSGADAARLQQLLKEQATLQAAQTQAQYKTLAQQIAEIASSTGEDWQQVIADMGINAKDLEKGLGLADDAALGDYLAAIQTQTDSNGENTTSIIDAIHDIGDQITAAITGPTRPDESGGVKQTNDLLNAINENLSRIAIVTADGNTDNSEALAEVAAALGTVNDTLARGVANGTLVARR